MSIFDQSSAVGLVIDGCEVTSVRLSKLSGVCHNQPWGRILSSPRKYHHVQDHKGWLRYRERYCQTPNWTRAWMRYIVLIWSKQLLLLLIHCAHSCLTAPKQTMQPHQINHSGSRRFQSERYVKDEESQPGLLFKKCKCVCRWKSPHSERPRRCQSQCHDQTLWVRLCCTQQVFLLEGQWIEVQCYG